MQSQNSIPTNPPVNNRISRHTKILTGFYIVFLMILLIFFLLKLIGAPGAGTDSKAVLFCIGFSCTPDSLYMSTDVQHALIVIIGGALGALIHITRSFVWHIGKKDFDLDWLPFYFLHPFSGATLALASYLIMRGGFMSAPSNVDPTSLYSFTALALLVGSFSENAWTKLKQVAETIFTKSDRAIVQVPQIQSINPVSGKLSGNEDVIIKGTCFQSDSQVKFGDKLATVDSFDKANNTLKVKTPAADAPGEVDVVVINVDKVSNAVKFTYNPDNPSSPL